MATCGGMPVWNACLEMDMQKYNNYIMISACTKKCIHHGSNPQLNLQQHAFCHYNQYTTKHCTSVNKE